MLAFCPRHKVGYNDELDPVCPQCAVAKWEPPEPLAVDTVQGSPGYGRPILKGEAQGSPTLPNILGR